MNKISKSLLAVLSCVVLSLPAYTQQVMFYKSKNKRSNFTLFTLKVTTRNGKPVSGLMEERDYLGRSQSAPCSDMKLLYSGSGYTELAPGLYEFNADGFKDYPGPGYTCYKMDLIILGKTYSTDNIQLVWSEANLAYIDAYPKVIPLDLNE